MKANKDTASAINNSLLLMCDHKNKKDFLINRLAQDIAIPCFAFTKTASGNSLKKSMVSIVRYNSSMDCFIADNGISYSKVVYLGFIGECNQKQNPKALSFTTSKKIDVAANVTNSAYDESLDDFDILQQSNIAVDAEKSLPAEKTTIASLGSFKEFMAVYNELPLMTRSINNFSNNELEWFYHSTVTTELARLSVEELLTNGRIINLVEACDKLSCTIEELEQSIKETVADESKCVWSVVDASDWVNCNFVLVYLK